MKKISILMIVLVFAITGCQKYEKKPIDTHEVIKQQSISSDSVISSPFSFNELLEITSTNNKDLVLIKAQYEKLNKFANTKTPLDNPQIGIGLSKAFSLEGATQSLTQPFVSLGFNIPLWGKRKLARELEHLEATAMLQEYIILHRSIYLELRSFYTKLQLNTYKLELINELISTLKSDLDVAEKQLILGNFTLLDLGLLKADYETILSEKQEIDLDITQDYSLLSALSGISLESIRYLAVPRFKTSMMQIPTRETALQHLTENSFELNRLHAKYDIAEKSLELEVRKQFPDLQIDSGFDLEPGERTKYLGISLGIEIPLFNRNQKGILASHQYREQIFLEYQLKARQAIIEMDTAIKMISQSELKLNFIQKELLATKLNNYELAKKDYQRNTISKTDLINARIAYYETKKEIINQLDSYLKYGVMLETATGTILFNQKDKQYLEHTDQEKTLKENNNKGYKNDKK